MPEAVPPVAGSRAAQLAACTDRHWRANRHLMLSLLLLWAFFGLGCGVLWADWLNQFQLAGFPLGFWFAQQGSILGFVLLVLAYAVLMGRIDRRHRQELAALPPAPATDEAGR